jgi:tRNA (cmo5U34)-methyltransferase
VTINEAFNNSVGYYDSWIRKAIPGYDLLFGAARDLLPFTADSTVAVLDLGAGTGLFAKQIFDHYPNSRFVLWDVADKMLDVARERFRDHPDRFRYVVNDYRNLRDAGKFDLVISSLSIHHLVDREKRELFRRIYEILNVSGLFINIDLIKGPTRFLEELYCRNWYAQMKLAGATDAEIEAGIERRLTYDREALLEDQLLWLKEAGFVDADCAYRNFKVGLFVAMKRMHSR